jgi:hypothetical protein
MTHLQAALAGALLLAAAPTMAAPLNTDVTNGGAFSDAQGPSPFRFFGTGGSRAQTVYESRLFGNFDGPRAITAIAFRAFLGSAPGAFFGPTVAGTDVTVRLSTTARGESGPLQLSTSFADNLGTDLTTVFTGPFSVTTTLAGSFDYVLRLATPFVYDPSRGNLLLDVLIPTTAEVLRSGILGNLTFDQLNRVGDGVASVGDFTNGGATRGFLGTDGAAIRFVSEAPGGGGAVAVPVPHALALFGFGLIALGVARRRAD